MVMHARKTQRLNDGYFEKHQSHPYQNSKYGSSKSYAGGSDRYDGKFRDSPNGSYRSDNNSPESQSPRDGRDSSRAYQSKSSYLQKMREKERENRDYKMSRDKYNDCARSPKEKRSRDSEHRTNNDRNDEKSILHPIKASQLSSRDRKPMHNNCVDKRDERDRVPRVGDWSEHVSSSGKKYYYNCKTEVSQWEKPREWVDRERDSRFRGRDRDRDRDSYGGSSRSGMRHEKHSNSRGPNSSGSGNKDGGSRDSATVSGSGGNVAGGGNGSSSTSRHWSSGSSRDDSDAAPASGAANKESTSSRGGATTAAGGGGGRKTAEESAQQQQATQDMDISPGDSTPTSETSYGNSSSQPGPDPTAMGPVLLANALPRLISHPIQQQQQQPQPHQQCQNNQHIQQQQQLQQAQQIPQQLTSSSTSPQGVVTSSNAPGPPMMGVVTTLPAALRLSAATSHQAMQQCDGGEKQQGSGSGVQRSASMPVGDLSGASSLLTVDTSNHAGGGGVVVEGPPTPTHSETPDCTKVVAVPSCSPSSGGAAPNGGGGGACISSLQGMSSSLQALRPQGPTITPSLANHYRDDLVNHVRGWPADILEKQAQKLAEEAHVMGSLQCSKVSAELKSARSIVRLTEIQATLQEQRLETLYFLSSLIELKWIKFCLTNHVKYCENLTVLKEDIACIEQSCRMDRILFLRQQIKELEELKSQNSFMSDDS